MSDQTYGVVYSARAKRQLGHTLPEAVAIACFNFITDTLSTKPRRVGKPLLPPLAPQFTARRGQYRVIYTIDDENATITIVSITHRADSYR